MKNTMTCSSLFQVFTLLLVVKCTTESNLRANIPNARAMPVPPIVKHDGNPEVLSVVVTDTERQKRSGSFVHFVDVPKIIGHRSPITCAYTCTVGTVIGLQLQVKTISNDTIIAFHRKWRCLTDKERRSVRSLTLPDFLAYKPSYFNRDSQVVASAQLLLWKINGNIVPFIRNKLDYFQKATVKTSLAVSLLSPYERPSKPTLRCPSWWLEVQMGQPFTPQCPKQPEVIMAVDFPLALSGHHSGVHRLLPEYTDVCLLRERKNSILAPKFTISVWLYLVEYCPTNQPLCSIVQSLRPDETYCTPLLFINNRGQVHIQVKLADGSDTAFLTTNKSPIPKLRWCHLVLTADNKQWRLTMMCEGLSKGTAYNETTSYIYKSDIYYDDTECLTIFGGSETAPAFKGYIGEAVTYRRKAFGIHQLPRKQKFDQIFELGLGEWNTKCRRYLLWSEYIKYQSTMLYQEIMDRKSCKNPVYDILYKSTPTDSRLQCMVHSGHIPKHYALAYRTVRNFVLQGVPYTTEDIAKVLMENVTGVLENLGLLGIKDTIPLLRQASCYGDHDATFMLATILNNGMGTKLDEVEAHKYLMFGAMEGNELSNLALGNKHVLGLDGVPQDVEQAYVYYKEVAEKTKADKEKHQEDGVFTEHVRLTDEDDVNSQTDEEGDIFQWFKHQAQRGVVSAQQEMARMLYWGSRGVSRDVKAAANFYEMGAKKKDPTSLYNYGIINMKGQGVPKNMTKARELFEEAASMGYHMAHNVIGWMALEEGDVVTAANYLNNAYKAGNVDAAHNLGYMFAHGKYPGWAADRAEAFKYYTFAATRGQLDSGIVIGQYNIRGGAIDRNPQLALEWVRFIGEQNVALGKVLRKGLQAYRNHNWPSSVVYYHMAAETGLEVGTFNTAYLCDENDDGLINYLEKDCIWRFYNLTIQRDTKHQNSYVSIKMGDYFWYGYQGNRDADKAATYYGYAAKQGDPQALFSLGFMVEDGARLPLRVLRDIRYYRGDNDTTTILTHIYSKCSNSEKSEAYFLCSLALYRIKATDFWLKYSILVKVSGALGGMLALAMTTLWLASYFRNQHPTVSNV